MESNKASHRSFTETLPKKRMGAGCLFFDELGRVLLVKPTYKPVWEIPGGIVEQNESPLQCCQREVREEIGLEQAIGELLVVDYSSQTEDKTESLMFVFNGGVLHHSQIGSIQLKQDELSAACFFNIEALPVELTGTLRKRVLAAWEQASIGNGIYLENQTPIAVLTLAAKPELK